jgi:hypothetical protein
MNPFWKTIVTTLLGAASIFGAKYSANWIANNTYRTKPAQQMVAEVPRPVYAPAVRHVNVPNHILRSRPLRPPHLNYPRH